MAATQDKTSVVKRLVFGAVLAVLSAGLHAQRPSAQPLKYLFRGVSFYVNDSNVRLREGPGTNTRVLGLLDAGTVVIPIAASNESGEKISGYPLETWYKCLLEKDRNKSGWIFGEYVSCRLSRGASDLWAVQFTARHGPRIEMDVVWAFVNGEYQNEYTLKELASRDEVLPILRGGTGSAERIGGMRVSCSGERRIVGELTEGELPGVEDPREGFFQFDAPAALVGNSVAMIGGREIETISDMSTFTAFHDHVLDEFERQTGKRPAFRDIEREADSMEKFTLTDGQGASSDFYYCTFRGSFAGIWVAFDCFFIRHPDGSLIRTNIYHSAISSHIAGIVEASNLPVSLIRMEREDNTWEGGYYDLYITNGYVVFSLGEEMGWG
jgi:hypothetical protein